MPIKGYCCITCRSSFTILPQLRQHICEEHQTDDWPSSVEIIGNPPFFICGFCGFYTGESVDSLKKHWRENHNKHVRANIVSQRPEIQSQSHSGSRSAGSSAAGHPPTSQTCHTIARRCGKCNKDFGNKTTRDEHELGCTGELADPKNARYSCGACHAGYKHQRTRDRHEYDCSKGPSGRVTRPETAADLTHPDTADETVNTCPFCNRPMNYIRNHLRGSHLDKAGRDSLIYCEKCGQPCKSNADLDKHNLKNPGHEIPCRNCNKKFINIETRDRHEGRCKKGPRRDSGAVNRNAFSIG